MAQVPNGPLFSLPDDGTIVRAALPAQFRASQREAARVHNASNALLNVGDALCLVVMACPDEALLAVALTSSGMRDAVRGCLAAEDKNGKLRESPAPLFSKLFLTSPCLKTYKFGVATNAPICLEELFIVAASAGSVEAMGFLGDSLRIDWPDELARRTLKHVKEENVDAKLWLQERLPRFTPKKLETARANDRKVRMASYKLYDAEPARAGTRKRKIEREIVELQAKHDDEVEFPRGEHGDVRILKKLTKRIAMKRYELAND